MNIIRVEKKQYDINILFYTFLKILNSNDGFTDKQLNEVFEILHEAKNYNSFLTIFKSKIIGKITSVQKKIILNKLIENITCNTHYKIFIFANYILKFKPLLIEYAKLIDTQSITKDSFPLSLQRDNETKLIPYAFRVNGALISLLFFDFIEQKNLEKFPTSQYATTFIDKLFNLYSELKNTGLEAKQIFNILLQESISQSIKSTAGSNLENLVVTLLSNDGVEDITKKIDSNNHEIEYDHFFILDNKKYGISTKRTLRERYKQFKKTETAEADIFIHITSGLDLNEEKSKTITSDLFGCYIFVFPEIYEKSPYMLKNKKIFSTTELTLKTLTSLS